MATVFTPTAPLHLKRGDKVWAPQSRWQVEFEGDVPTEIVLTVAVSAGLPARVYVYTGTATGASRSRTCRIEDRFTVVSRV